MKRECCQQCLRPLEHCLCAFIRPLSLDLPITIIQHPLEANHPFNTARPAHLTFTNSTLVQAELLDKDTLLTPHMALLYPLENAVDLDATSTALPFLIEHLLVLDGTWRKVRKILHLNPWLTQLPALSLSSQREDLYTIRKKQPGQLSTMEAIYYTLERLGQPVRKDHLMVLHHMVLQQKSFLK